MDRDQHDAKEKAARSRYPSATQRAAAVAEGKGDDHPADRLRDPPREVLVQQNERVATAEPRLKHIGGSSDDAFNLAVAEAARQTAWIVSPAGHDEALKFVGKALAGIAPRDEAEGMLAAQMVAMHMASLECSRRAMLPNQSVDVRAMNLKAAARSSQTYTTLLGALDKHRNRGQQKVIVEHLYIADGGKAFVGNVEGPRGGETRKNDRQPHGPQLIHTSAPFAAMWGQDPERDPLPVAGNAERPLPDARRGEPRRTKG